MVDKFMYIHNDDTQDYPVFKLNQLKRLNTQPNKPTNQNLIKFPKVIKQTNEKTLL